MYLCARQWMNDFWISERMSLVASPILLDNTTSQKNNLNIHSYTSSRSPVMMNGTKTQSGIFMNTLESSHATGTESSTITTARISFSHSAKTSPVNTSDTELNGSVRTGTPTADQTDIEMDVDTGQNEVKRAMSSATTTSRQSVTETASEFLLSPNKRLRLDGSESAQSTHTSNSNSLPCPCGKHFPDSATFVDHARQCEEFALTANSFAEAAAAVASATNGMKATPIHSAVSSPRITKSTTPTRLEHDNMQSPDGTGSSSTACNEPLIKCGSGVYASGGNGGVSSGHLALDLSLRSQELQPSASSPEAVTRTCSECKYTHSNLPHLYHHFETVHDSRGHFDCACGENFAWLPSLLKHRLHCTSQVRTSSSSNPNPVISSTANPLYCHPGKSPTHSRSETYLKGNSDWPPGTHAVPAPKSLHCTGCGKTGFTNPTEVLNHFNHCPVLMHRSRSPSTGLSLPSNSFSRPSPNGPGSFGHWSSSLYGSIPTPPVSSVTTRADLGYPPSGFPLGFMPPLGYSPYPKSYNSKSGLTSFTGKTAQKAFTKSAEMRAPTGGVKDLPNHLNHHSHGGPGVSTTATNHTDTHVNTDLTRPFKCCHCIKAFKSKALLDQHMHIHYPPKYTCRYCAKKYRWPPVFYHHQRTCKKRPPSTSASTTTSTGTSVDSSSGATATTTHTFHTRSINSNGLGTTDSSMFPLPPGYFFSSPMDHNSGSNQNPPHNGSGHNTNGPRLPSSFPFLSPSHPSLHGHSFGSDLFSASLAAFYDPLSIGSNSTANLLGNTGSNTTGHSSVPNPSAMLAAAAACAAMGMRVPFGHPLPPPPLGFNPSYNTDSGPGNSLPFVSSCSPGSLFPPLLPPAPNGTGPPSTLPTLLPLQTSTTGNGQSTNTTAASLINPLHSFPNPAMFFPTTGTTSSPVVSHTLTGVRTSMDLGSSESSRALLCVCSQQFGSLPLYLNHLANCVTLQRLVQPSNKSDDPVTSANLSFPYNPAVESGNMNSTDSFVATSRQGANDKETMLFSSAMAAMNAIMSRAQPQTDKNSKGNQSIPEGSSSLNESVRTGLSESTWSVDRQHHSSGQNSVSPKVIGQCTKSESDDSPNQQSPRQTELAELKVEQSTPDFSWDGTKPDTTASDVQNTNLCVPPNGLDLNGTKITANTDFVLSTEAPMTGGSNSTNATIVTPETTPSLMAAMATVLANAAAAAGFPCSNLSEELSPSIPGTPVTHMPCSELDHGTNPMTSVNTAMMMMMNGSIHAKLCVQCGKEFSSRLSLKQHVEGKHSAEGKYQCPGCAKRYRWGASYYYHKKSCPAIREPSPLSADLFLDSYDDRGGNESTPPPPPPPPSALPLPHPPVLLRSPRGDSEQEDTNESARTRSTNLPSPDTDRVQERGNEYLFDGERELLPSPVARFQPLSAPLDMRHGHMMKNEDQYAYSPSNETPRSN